MSSKVRRIRTTVSLAPSVWKLAEEAGGTRGRGLETMAIMLLGFLSSAGNKDAETKLTILQEEINNARS